MAVNLLLPPDRRPAWNDSILVRDTPRERTISWPVHDDKGRSIGTMVVSCYPDSITLRHTVQS